MQEFYKKALYVFILIVLADALLAIMLVDRSYLSQPLLPAQQGGDERAVRWRFGFTSSPWDARAIHVDQSARDQLRFDLNLPADGADPIVSADLLAVDGKGKPALADLSKYGTVSFVAKCSPANSMMFIASIYDEHLSQPGNYLTYPPALTYFSCNEQGVPVSLDLTRLTIPQWWFDTVHRDLSRQDYVLDRVERLVFGATGQSPRGVPAHVEISWITLHGRDYRYLAWLTGLVVAGWIAFGVWFFRAHARALLASVDTQLKKDLPLVAYRQLTLEPYRDKEKAAVLKFIATNYTNTELDLEGVVAATGTNRTKVNDVLKSELGMTFTSYLNKLRLTEAARLLTEKTGTTVAEIAFSVGYANVSYFNKLFKEEYGCTPKAFRTLAAQQEPPPDPHQQTAAP
ncbi:helix-turn-helix domain-containing protein [Massilia putida]|uniref:helix-turn-helix domain-containing protein n=1 Tax=Massilia putida TaxID=1141883 RepID=UPI000952C215|nr:helix-turn-helix domain-containing protein [Massilia putida]